MEEKQIGDPFVNIELFFSHYEKKFPEFRDAYSNFYQSKRAGLISAFQANNISLEVCNLQFNQLSISPLRTYALHQPAPAQQPQPIVNQADEMDVDNGPDFSAGPQ